jgi:hypothetical protein
MADIALTQEVADKMIKLPKIVEDETEYDFPPRDVSTIIPLCSEDRKQAFFLNIRTGRIKLSQMTFNLRCRQVIVLVRLDLDGPPHKNPDGELIPCPHLHVYREGFGDKWAIQAPADHFQDLSDQWAAMQDFLTFIAVVEQPHFRRGLNFD